MIVDFGCAQQQRFTVGGKNYLSCSTVYVDPRNAICREQKINITPLLRSSQTEAVTVTAAVLSLFKYR
jgi:hypothetical protein